MCHSPTTVACAVDGRMEDTPRATAFFKTPQRVLGVESSVASVESSVASVESSVASVESSSPCGESNAPGVESSGC